MLEQEEDKHAYLEPFFYRVSSAQQKEQNVFKNRTWGIHGEEMYSFG